MKHLFYPLAFGTFILASCSNDEPAVAFVLPGDYQAAATIVAAPIALYTKDGLVNNPTLVDNLLRRRNINAPSYFSRVDIPTTGNGLKLSIKSNGQALLISTYPARTDTVKASVSNQTADSFMLTNADSLLTVSSSNSSGFSYRCDLLAGSIKAIYPVKHCRPVSVGSGTVSDACWSRPVKRIDIRNGQLFVPIFSWFVETGQPTTCGTGTGGEWNTFNPAILNQLVAGDTIVVQTRSVALTRI